MSSRALARSTLYVAASAALGAAVVLAPSPAGAQDSGIRMHSRLNDTGLTRCTHDLVHFARDCAGTGQDAASGRDVTHRSNRDGAAGFAFQKVCNSGEFAGTGTCTSEAVLGPGPDDWGCTYDKVTRLEWEVKTTDGGLRDGRNVFTNLGDGSSDDTSTYLTTLNAAGLCGAGDWRLPSTYELQSIDDFNQGQRVAGVDNDWFPNTVIGSWWAAEGYFGQPTVAWLVSTAMNGGNINVVGLGRDQAISVRVVRDPTLAQVPMPRFVASADGQEVTDRVTKLVWSRCVEGMHYSKATGHCGGHYSTYTADKAWAHANDVATRTGLPWRVANAKELHSIADETVGSLAIDAAEFPDTPAVKEWTSTVISWVKPTGAWVVDFNDARVLAYGAWFVFPVRLVRGGD